MSTRVNPIRLFVTHSWDENDDYSRVFEYLEARVLFTITTRVSRTAKGRSTRKASARSYAVRSHPAKSSSSCRPLIEPRPTSSCSR